MGLNQIMEPFGADVNGNESKAFIRLAQLELRMKMSKRQKRKDKKMERKKEEKGGEGTLTGP